MFSLRRAPFSSNTLLKKKALHSDFTRQRNFRKERKNTPQIQYKPSTLDAILREPQQTNPSSIADCHNDGRSVAKTNNTENIRAYVMSQNHEGPLYCTDDQLNTIRKHLPPNDCNRYKDQPWLQKCSFTQTTKGPIISGSQNILRKDTSKVQNRVSKKKKRNF